MRFNIAQLEEALGASFPERDAITWRGNATSWGALTERTRRLAQWLEGRGFGRARFNDATEPWQSPHNHVALYMHNRPEYLEGMLGAWKAGASAFNVNYRYVAHELAYVLNDASTAAIIYTGAFSERVAEVLPHLDRTPALIRVADGTNDDLLPGASDYDEALAAADVDHDLGPWLPSDRYLLYTGGTTGYPKGVLWEQDDFLVGALGMRAADGEPYGAVEAVVEKGRRGDRLRTLPAPPFMHGAAHWNALSTLLAGGTVVIQSDTERFGARDVCDTIRQERVSSLLIVGDAFARPLIDELESTTTTLESLRFILTGGAILSPAVKARLLELLPQVQIVDVLGSSESGRQGVARTTSGSGSTPTRFRPDPLAAVVSDDKTRVLEVGDTEIGWLAQAGRVPLGYLGDPVKTAATFPTIDGVRYAIPGDRARLDEDGSVELLGREAATINTGGEKVFAEEVEQALKSHPAVADALVVGRPSERWGSEVVAVVSLRDGRTATTTEVLDSAGRTIARYKLPKALVLSEQIARSPSGKPDYTWARTIVGEALGSREASPDVWHRLGADA